MQVIIRLPRALSPANAGTLRINVHSVDDVMSAAASAHPWLRQNWMRDGMPKWGLARGNEILQSHSRLEDGDSLSVIPWIGGGMDPVGAGPETVSLSRDEMLRYSRHIIMPEVDVEGQKRLKAAKVLCIGAGGLGSPLTMYLAAAGVGTIGIVDFDVVDVTNLQRQIAHGTEDVGRPKLDSAADTLRSINPFVNVIGYPEMLSSENAIEIMKDYDIVIDGTDNFPTRYLVNDACVLLGKPNVYGSIFRFEGQASVFWAEHGPCYRCLYPEPPPPGMVPSCAEGGVLGILPGIIGVMQATEAVKLILGIGEPLVGRLVLFNALKMEFREMKLRKDPTCPICGEHPSITELIDYQEFCGIPKKPADSVEPELTSLEISARGLADRFAKGERPVVIDVREPFEWEIARIPYTILIPMNEVPSRLAEIPMDQEVILHCKGGVRSQRVLEYLQSQGYSDLKNMVGGILAWSDDVDPAVAKY